MAKKKKGLRNINPGDTVEFLNYITPDHIIRAKYNTGDNGMDITDVPQNLNSYIVLGGGSGVTVEPLSVTSNGLYTAPMGKAYTPVDVNVPVPPSVTVESLSVTSNGTYTAPTGKAYSPVDVNVPATPSVTVESLSVTSNGNYTAPAGKAYSPVDVNVPQTTIESLSVTLNGTYNAPTGKAYDPVVVNVPQTTVESLSVTSNGTYTAPAGKAYSPVTVNVAGISIDDFATRTQPSGAVTLTANNIVVMGLAGSINMTSITADSVTTLRQSILMNCSGLTSLSFAAATGISGTQQFNGCSSLTSANIPNVTFLNDQMFQNCSNLEFLDLPKVTAMNHSGIFRACYKFATLVLRHTSVVPINNDVFANTPFAGYSGLTGEVYVPESLIPSYQTATNWSTLYNNGTTVFKKIEGSIYE